MSFEFGAIVIAGLVWLVAFTVALVGQGLGWLLNLSFTAPPKRTYGDPNWRTDWVEKAERTRTPLTPEEVATRMAAVRRAGQISGT